MGAKARRSLLLGFGGVLWLLAVLLMYAYTHKPFTPLQIAHLLREGWQVTVALGIASLAGGLGYKLFPPRDVLYPLAGMAIQVALGFGVLGILIFFLGVSIGFSFVIFAVLFLLCFIFLFKDIFAWWRQASAFSIIWRESDRFEKGLVFGIFFLLLAAFLKSLAPPLAFDSLVYHLTLPKLYLLEGRISYIPELMFWGMPQQAEMLYTFAMTLGGTETAVILSYFVGSFTLTGLLGYLSQRFSIRVAWVALVSLLAGQTLSDALSWAYVEWIVMLYGFSVFVLLDEWKQNRDRKLFWIAAILTGFAIGTKYTAGILLVAAFPIIFLANSGRDIRFALKDILLFGGLASLIVSPWLIKNILATGNPVYPLLLPAGEMNVYRLHLYQGDPAWGDWRDALFLPWRATIWGLSGKAGYSAEIGSLLLAFSPLVWIGWKERDDDEKGSLQTALVIMLTGFLLWAVAGRTSRLLIQTRLYLALFPAWAILAGVGFESFSRLRASGIRFGRIASVLLFLSFGFNIFQTGVDAVRLGVGKSFLGVHPSSLYREQALGKYETAMTAIAELPSDSQILMLWETRGFACVPQCEPDEIIDRWYADIRIYDSPDAVLDAWRDEGFGYLLFNKRGADFIRENDTAYSDNDWVALNEMLMQLELVNDFDGEYKIYSLRSTK